MAISLDRAIKELRACHPRARFFQVVENLSTRQSDNEIGEQNFHYINLYEHRITNGFEPFKGHSFVVSNSFVSSYIYNLALVWVWHSQTEHASTERLDAALRHNLKKFFAERALAERNCLFARALLIETIMYEQDLMQPIFDAAEKNSTIKEFASDLAHLMSVVLGYHELAHFHLHRSPDVMRAYVAALFGGAVEPAIKRATASFGQNLAEEIICDSYAIQTTINGISPVLQKYDVITRSRMTAFHFMVFKYLVDLEKSALMTIDSCADEDAAIIDIFSEKRPKVDFSFVQGYSTGTDFRVTEAIKLISNFCESRGQVLFGDDGNFKLPISIQQYLRQSYDRFADEIDPVDGGLTGTDFKRRALAKLLAESLHGYDKGADFLLWRSKRFIVGGKANDP